MYIPDFMYRYVSSDQFKEKIIFNSIRLNI